MSVEIDDLPDGVSTISARSSELLVEGAFIVKLEDESKWRICLSKKLSPVHGRFSDDRFETEDDAIKAYLDKTTWS